MTLRTEQVSDTRNDGASTSESASIRFRSAGDRPSLGERIVAAARAASAMHLTGAALISADEAAILALGEEEIA